MVPPATSIRSFAMVIGVSLAPPRSPSAPFWPAVYTSSKIQDVTPQAQILSVVRTPPPPRRGALCSSLLLSPAYRVHEVQYVLSPTLLPPHVPASIGEIVIAVTLFFQIRVPLFVASNTF